MWRLTEGYLFPNSVFLRKFRALRKRMGMKACASGIYTDEDVFDRVS